MNELIIELDELHTTELGSIRIKRNLGLDESINSVEYCKAKICELNTRIQKIGKNFYATTSNEIITINASKLSIITAHKIKN